MTYDSSWRDATPEELAAAANGLKHANASARQPDTRGEAQPTSAGATEGDPEALVADLAAMPPLEYDRVRNIAAGNLGIRTSTLDGEVRKKRAELRSDSTAGQAMQFARLEPWLEPVDASGLLEELADSATRYLVLPEHADTALALWVLFTHVIDAAEAAPILAIRSPEKRCGKSKLLDWLSCLVRNPLPAANVSSAAVFRAIEKWQPTLLIDEADTILRDNEELRAILNSGHTRATAYVIRTVGDEHEPRRFATWGAKAIALIGHLPDTTADRCITIEMRRRMPSERVFKLRGEGERRHLEEIARRCQRFAIDALPALKVANPAIPDGLNDRDADSWTSLLSIADLAGDEWPASARAAASVLCGVTPDGDSLKVELLRDVCAAFTARERDRLGSSQLAEALAADPERPWAEFNRGKPITVRQLARLLNSFGIVSGTVRLDDGLTLKGYKCEDFADAFARYVSPSGPSQRHTPMRARVVTDTSNITDMPHDGSSLGSQTSTDASCDGVTDENPGVTRIDGIADDEERF